MTEHVAGTNLMLSIPQVIKQYIKKSLLEKELLYFGYEIFGVTFVDPVSATSQLFLGFISCLILVV